MIKGYAQRRLDRDAWEIALVDRDNKRCYTFEFKSHDAASVQTETTLVDSSLEYTGILQALTEALNQMGLFPDNATAAELKATKLHLEDLRKLVFE
jgi:hypothetical protein